VSVIGGGKEEKETEGKGQAGRRGEGEDKREERGERRGKRYNKYDRDKRTEKKRTNFSESKFPSNSENNFSISGSIRSAPSVPISTNVVSFFFSAWSNKSPSTCVDFLAGFMHVQWGNSSGRGKTKVEKVSCFPCFRSFTDSLKVEAMSLASSDITPWGGLEGRKESEYGKEERKKVEARRGGRGRQRDKRRRGKRGRGRGREDMPLKSA
jgi:hypothetical protein